jgi:hypothetical protein
MDDSNITRIALYKAWNKPEKAKQWQLKLPDKQATGEQ